MKTFFTIAIGVLALTGFSQSQMNIFRHSGQLLQIPLSDIDSITYSTIVSGPVLASVTTSMANNITQTGCTSGGNVTSDGGSPVTEKGICYSTGPSPTIFNTKMVNGSGTGDYVDTLIGLTSGTTYYLRAYATNAIGTSYGNQVIFTTSPNGPVNVITINDSVLSSINIQTSFLYPTKYVYPNLKRILSTAFIGETNNVVEFDFPELDSIGNNLYIAQNPHVQKILAPKIRSLGGYLYVYKNPQLQQLDVCHLSDMYCVSGESYFFLSQNNTVIDSGIPQCLHPVMHNTELSLNPVTVFSNNTAIVTGVYTHNCYVVLPKICWSTHTNPTIDDFYADLQSDGNDINNTLTGLVPNTTYYVRVYVNGRYFNEVSFTTLP